MRVEQLTHASFDEAVMAHAMLVVAFAAPDADPGRLDALAGEHADVTFAWVDASAEPALAAMFGLPGTDALVMLRERVVLYCEPGPHPASRIEALVAQVRALDMDAVRAAIEAEKAELALRMRRVCPTARRGPVS